MRAFTKFFAIPGLRLGYGISFDEEILKKMWEEKEPWTVNTFANLAGIIMLEDKDYMEKTEKWISEEKNFIYQALNKFQHLKDRKSTRLNSSHANISYAVFCLKKKDTASKLPNSPMSDE